MGNGAKEQKKRQAQDDAARTKKNQIHGVGTRAM
jgi:hypothetical protein